jgi:hypothetical protein
MLSPSLEDYSLTNFSEYNQTILSFTEKWLKFCFDYCVSIFKINPYLQRNIEIVAFVLPE